MATESPLLSPHEDPDPWATGAPLASLAVGLDLVLISALSASLARFKGRFLARIYTPDELLYCLAEPATAPARLAARFAAKEAVLKVLRVDDEPVNWRSVEVRRSPGGGCQIALHGAARALAHQAGFFAFSLSMTHEGDYASAVVIGQKSPTGAP